MNHFFLKIISMTSWLITALASINVGLAPFGYNLFQMDFFMTRPELIAPICYVILAAGIISLAHLVMVFMGHCGCDSSGKAKCK